MRLRSCKEVRYENKNRILSVGVLRFILDLSLTGSGIFTTMPLKLVYAWDLGWRI